MSGKRYEDGEFWLDKRRDGKSPDIWQIATYRPQSRSVVYRSTHCRTEQLDEARKVLHAYAAAQRSAVKGQTNDEAVLMAHLVRYLDEHGADLARKDTVVSSFRAIAGWLQQDELGTGARVVDINKVTIARFRRWRMNPHEYRVEWAGKVYDRKSPGVSGEAVQRNLEDLRAALNHAEAAGRIVAPKVPMVDKKLRSEPRDTTVTFDELGAIWGYARQDWPVWRELCLMIGTTCRPGAAFDFNPGKQWRGDVIDLLPEGRARTNKRRAVVPVIKPLRPILEGWAQMPHKPVLSRKKWWQTARRLLSLRPEITLYTIRHTLLTYLDGAGVPGAQISGLAGHIPSARGIARTTARSYLHYDPTNAPELKAALTTFWQQAWEAADQWSADHLLTITKDKNRILVARDSRKC